MAYPSFGSVGTALAAGSAANAVVAVPAGTAAGHIVLVHIYKESTATVTAPSGFAEITPSPSTTGNVHKHHIFWKRLTGADSGTYTFTWTGAVWRAGYATRWTDCATTGTPYEGVSTNSRSAVGATSPTVAVTTTGPERLIVWSVMNFDGGTWSGQNAGWTERVDTANESGAMFTNTVATASTTASLSATCTATGYKTSFAFALLPAGITSTKTGGAFTRASGSGPDTVVRIVTKTGGGATRGAGSAPKVTEIQDRTRAIATIGAMQSATVTVKNVALAVTTTMGAEPMVLVAKRANARVLTRLESVSSTATVKHARVAASTEMTIISDTYLQIFGRDEPPPYLEVITAPYIAPQRRGLRVIAQRIITGQFLDWNVPLKNPEITYTLSGPTMIRGVIGPESQDIRDIGLDAWGTWLHVEENDEIKASGILLPQEIPGEYLNVEAAGVSYYPQEMPWKGHLSEIQIDPAEVIRRIWAHLQSYPEGKLNVAVSSTTTPVRLGEAGYTETTANEDGTTTSREVPAKPYELNWWEAPDCGSEIDNLVRSTPLDFVERSQWNSAKTMVNNYIDLGYPRIGRRLIGNSAPRFVQNENATEMFVLGETPDLYASEVLVLGKGEGSKMIRGEVGLRNTGRLRRVAVRSDPAGISTNARAVAIGRDELRRRAALLTIGDVTIDSTNALAPMGSFRVGDDILVQADVPYHGSVSLWHRIISYTWSPDTERVTVQLRRSEQYM